MRCKTRVYEMSKAALRARGASLPRSCGGGIVRVWVVICFRHFDFIAYSPSRKGAETLAKRHREST